MIRLLAVVCCWTMLSIVCNAFSSVGFARLKGNNLFLYSVWITTISGNYLCNDMRRTKRRNVRIRPDFGHEGFLISSWVKTNSKVIFKSMATSVTLLSIECSYSTDLFAQARGFEASHVPYCLPSVLNFSQHVFSAERAAFMLKKTQVITGRIWFFSTFT